MSFYVKVLNMQGKEIVVEVSLEVYNIFEEERKETERLRKEQSRHRDDTEVESDLVSYRNNLHTPSTLDTIIYQSELDKANKVIQSCTPTQQRRFHLNRILSYSLTEIAKMDNCAVRTVKQSVDVVIKKLEEIKKSF